MKDVTQLLEQLAIKLEVTVEYLWAVLLKQAMISGLMSAFFLLFIGITGFILYRIVKSYDKLNDSGEFLWVIGFPAGVICWSICLLIGLFEVSNMVTAFVNPEFWALDEILGNL